MKILIKTSRNPRHEFETQKILYRYFPQFIARPLKYKGNKIYMQFYKRRSLDKTITPLNTLKLVRRVKYIIKTIQRKFPLFRHNDLHIGNILLDDRGQIRLTDFELTRLKGRTPKIITRYGITNKVNRKYDIHCFLNSLRQFMIKKGRSVEVLNRMLPKGYRGKMDTYVRNFRLRA